MIRFWKQDKKLLAILLMTFILTELFDDLLDHLLGISLLHSVIQLALFVIIFFVVAKIVFVYQKKKINTLIPHGLMCILKAIHHESQKGILVNQVSLMKSLDITKPTIKKRLDNLINLKYISFEEEGNNKYIKLTSLGESIIK